VKTFQKIGITSLLLFLVACTDNSKDINKIEDPELVTVAFFNAIYNERDIKKAASVCNPKLARILMHYKSPSAVGRHLFNMSFDEVVVSPDSTGVKIREQFKDKAVITVYFEGMYQENLVKDVKRLSLVQLGNRWVINKILKDPF
jgi:hypothetical protein